jgi:hypothetical protein
MTLGVDVRDVCRNARTTNDIVQRKLADSRIELQEKGERLTDATRGTEDRDFGSLEAFSKSANAIEDEVDCYSKAARLLRLRRTSFAVPR